MGKQNPKGPKLDQALTEVLRVMDSQIARDLLRTPAERALVGVSKRSSVAAKGENVAAAAVTAVGSGASVEGLSAAATGLVKALVILAEELDVSGLGAERTACLVAALSSMSDDAVRALRLLDRSRPDA